MFRIVPWEEYHVDVLQRDEIRRRSSSRVHIRPHLALDLERKSRKLARWPHWKQPRWWLKDAGPAATSNAKTRPWNVPKKYSFSCSFKCVISKPEPSNRLAASQFAGQRWPGSPERRHSCLVQTHSELTMFLIKEYQIKTFWRADLLLNWN